MADIYVSKPFVKKERDIKGKSAPLEGVQKGQESLEGNTNTRIPFRLRKSFPFKPLSPFAFLPKDVDFETRDKDEKIVLLLRRHPITNLGWIILSILMSLAPLVLDRFPILDFLPANFRFVAILGWYMVVLAFVFENFLGWFFNVNIVTDERIIDIDFSNLTYKEISDADIDKIQDVTVKIGGVAETVFNYGDVYIQTASEKPRFEFLSIPKPEDVAKILQELRMEEKQEEVEGRIN